LPRALSLSKFPDGIRLVQKPISETQGLRERKFLELTNVSVPMAMQAMHLANVRGDTLEIEVELAPGDAKGMGLRLRKGAGEETILGFTPENKEVFVDRTRSGEVGFAPEFPGRHKASVGDSSRLKLLIFLDRSSIEVFVNDGERVLTDRIYPALTSDGIDLYSDSGKSRVLSLKIWKLGSVWR